MRVNKRNKNSKCNSVTAVRAQGSTVNRKTSVLTALITLVLIVGSLCLVKENTLYAEASGRPVAIQSCTIAGADVVCQLSAGSVPSGDDGKYYIYADEVYQDGPTGKVVATVDAGASVTAAFPLSYNTG
ncbi:MAG: hypothetical protein K2N77_14145, partial [Lachnospiraceae bacterium]|nr:hypothetical protein [Lachnospiraceae bacterium]